MEKAMSVDERIKRAEEIYSRRNGGYIRCEENKKTTKKEKFQNIKKLFMQIFVCLLIYIAFYTFNNKDYIFSEQFRNNVTQKIESVNFQQMYIDVKSFIKTKLLTKNEQNVENGGDGEKNNTSNDEVNNEQNNEENQAENVNENTTNVVENTETNNEEKSIGGADETKEPEVTIETTTQETTEQLTNEETEKELSQMEKDAQEIKAKTTFIVPVEGYISSTFGWRNPTISTVPKYHTGLDIAAVTGTVIKSATDGKVILASSEGDYGNHYKIQLDDIIIIYAHCSKLYLETGDDVKQGQEIAEVGSTGNSTGPHLHFEIRKEEREVDPQLILDI